jgi:hypothetical protein
VQYLIKPIYYIIPRSLKKSNIFSEQLFHKLNILKMPPTKRTSAVFQDQLNSRKLRKEEIFSQEDTTTPKKPKTKHQQIVINQGLDSSPEEEEEEEDELQEDDDEDLMDHFERHVQLEKAEINATQKEIAASSEEKDAVVEDESEEEDDDPQSFKSAADQVPSPYLVESDDELGLHRNSDEDEYEYKEEVESDNSPPVTITATPVRQTAATLHQQKYTRTTIVEIEEDEDNSDAEYQQPSESKLSSQSESESESSPPPPPPTATRRRNILVPAARRPARSDSEDSATPASAQREPLPLPEDQFSSNILNGRSPPPITRRVIPKTTRDKWTAEETLALEQGLWSLKGRHWTEIKKLAGDKLSRRGVGNIKDRVRTVMKQLRKAGVDLNNTAYKYYLNPQQ